MKIKIAMVQLLVVLGILRLQGAELPPDSPPPASLRLWMDAQSVDGSGNSTLTEGASVGSWTDNSSYDRASSSLHSASIFTLNGPLGRPTVRFTAPNFITGDGPVATNFPVTVFAVFSTTNTAQSAIFGLGDFASPDLNEVWIGTSNNVAAVHRRDDPAVPAASTAVVNDGRPHVMVARFVSNSSVLLYVDGQLVRTDTTSRSHSPTNYGIFSIGGVFDGSTESVPFTGDISEVRVYDMDFTDTERQQIEQRLFVKWIQRLPQITQQPQAASVAVGGVVSFSVVANSPLPLSYQWRRGTSNLPGATNATLTLTSVAREDSGQYSVRISNSEGSVDSAPTQLTVSQPTVAPTILSQPRNQSVAQGEKVVLSVTAQGGVPLQYQWRKAGVEMANATDATLQFNNSSPADSGSYQVVVSNSAGAVTSIVAVLNVSASLVGPSIITPPRGETVSIGATATFSVRATGSQPLTYQWLRNGEPLANATTSELTISPVTASDTGDYTVVVGNSVRSVTSSPAALQAKTAAAGQNTWTILVYGHGDHSLSVSLVEDMIEMERVGSKPGFNIVVQADFNSKANHYGGLPAGLEKGVSRFLLQQSPNSDALFSTPVQRLPELNQDNPANLTDFIRWGLQNYPADHVALILWDHGGQWQGFGGDQQDGTLQYGDGVLTAPINLAVKAALQGTSVKKFDFFAFDTCLMGGTEVLGDFTELSDVFIACPEIDYGPGWDYTATLGFLQRNPGVSARDFAATEVEKWASHHFAGVASSEFDKVSGAHAAYDLTAYPAFKNAFSLFSPLLLEFVEANTARFAQIRRETTAYSVHGAAAIKQATQFTDLGEVALKLANDPLASPALKDAAGALVSSISTMIINTARGTGKRNALGLSVFLPLDGDFTAEYKNLNLFSTDNTWIRLLDVIYFARTADQTAPVITDPQPGASRSVSRNTPTNLAFQVDDSADLHHVNGYLVSRSYTEDPNELVYLGHLFAAFDGAPLEGGFEWDGSAPIIWGADSSTGLYLGGFLHPSNPTLMTSYAEYLPPDADESQFVILQTDLSGDNPIIVAVLDGDSGSLAPIGIDLRPGGLLTPVYYTEYQAEDDPDTFESYGILASEALLIPADGLAGMEVALAYLAPNEYTISVQSEDDFGNLSQAVEFTVTIDPEPVSLQTTLYADGFMEISWFDTHGDTVLETTSDLGKAEWDEYIPNDYIDFDGDMRFFVFIPGDDGPHRFFRVTRP